MNNSYFKPSFSVSSLISEELREDSDRFILFLEAYYEWLQTAKITVTTSVGTFTRDETITGSTSGATAIVRQIPTGELVVRVKGTKPFEIGETLTGGTSGATAIVSSIKDNVIRSTGQLLTYRDVEKNIDKYVEYLKAELYSSLPSDLSANRRFIARKFRDFFQSKSNEKSYELLFNVLFNESIQLRYPGEDILRVSDGKFEKTQIIRAAVTNDIFNYIGQTITGRTSEALANVIDIKLFFIGSIQVAEITLKLVAGTFLAGETIEILDVPSSNTSLYGMVTGFTINDAGSGYEIGDSVVITSNTGSEAEAVVSSIKESPISAIKLNVPGYGYRLNTQAIINNSGTGGSDLLIRVTEIANTYTVTSGATTYTVGETSRVSILNRGENYFKAPTITLTDTTISSLGLLTEKLVTIANTGSNYGVGNTLVITGGSGANATGQVASITANASYSNTLLFEDGFEMLSEGGYEDVIKTEDWNVIGPVRRIEFTNFGDGYTSGDLPTITISSTTGSGANLVVTGIQGAGADVTVDVANNIAGIGAIRAVTINNFGINYNTANTTASLAASGDGNANVTPIVTGIGVSAGDWINDDGKVDYKVIQDSDFYSDFSYVIRTGLTIDRWSDIVKEIIHPAGLKFFGEILVVSGLIVTSEFLSDVQNYTIAILSTADGGIIDVTSIIVPESPTYNIIVEPDVTDTQVSLTPDVYTVTTLPYVNVELDLPSKEYVVSYTTLNSVYDSGSNLYAYLPLSALAQDPIATFSDTRFLDGYEEEIIRSSVNITIEPEKLDLELQNLYSTYSRQIFNEIDVSVSESLTSKVLNFVIESDILLLDITSVISADKVEQEIESYVELFTTVEASTFAAQNYTLNIFSEPNVAITHPTEIVIDIEHSESAQIELSKEAVIIVESFKSLEDLTVFQQVTKYLQIGLVTYVEQSNTTYADTQLLEFANTEINSVLASNFNSIPFSYETFSLSDYADATIGSIANSTFQTTPRIVVGTGTDFLNDFDIGDIMIANNEYLTVEQILTSTRLIIQTAPVNSFTNVPAYKQI